MVGAIVSGTISFRDLIELQAHVVRPPLTAFEREPQFVVHALTGVATLGIIELRDALVATFRCAALIRRSKQRLLRQQTFGPDRDAAIVGGLGENRNVTARRASTRKCPGYLQRTNLRCWRRTTPDCARVVRRQRRSYEPMCPPWCQRRRPRYVPRGRLGRRLSPALPRHRSTPGRVAISTRPRPTSWNSAEKASRRTTMRAI